MKDDLEKNENISLIHMPFNQEGFDQLKMTDFGLDWPIVYLIKNNEDMYVGETNSAINRLLTHYKDEKRKHLKDFYIVNDLEANKSIVLDVESLLIRYLSAD